MFVPAPWLHSVEQDEGSARKLIQGGNLMETPRHDAAADSWFWPGKLPKQIPLRFCCSFLLIGVLVAAAVPTVLRQPAAAALAAAVGLRVTMPDVNQMNQLCAQDGEDCRQQTCCASAGLQCYERDEKWATCMSLCTPGAFFDPDNTPWSCTQLGSRKVCTESGHNCIQSKCCAGAGLQCFAKDDSWAACRGSCHQGPDPEDPDPSPWGCDKLGPRTPGKSWRTQNKVAAPWVKRQCSEAGEDCSTTRCCSGSGMQCYRKNHHWASCRDSCRPGPDPNDENGDPWSCQSIGFRTPGQAPSPGRPHQLKEWVKTQCSPKGMNCEETRCCSGEGLQCYRMGRDHAECRKTCIPGQGWDCEKLGSRTPQPWGNPSLFCFSVCRETGYEPGLMRAQLKNEAGIFSCDEYAIFSDAPRPWLLGDGPMGRIQAIPFPPAKVGLSKDKTAGNALLFMHVWSTVKIEGRWNNHDWTVKVDPDAVFLASRLRQHTLPLTGRNAYIVNCNKYPNSPEFPMMFGSLEVFSRKALASYFKDGELCKQRLDWKSWGEDYYMGHCLDFLNVTPANDFTIIGDARCKGAHCDDGVAAAYHPFKDVGKWMRCFREASER